MVKCLKNKYYWCTDELNKEIISDIGQGFQLKWGQWKVDGKEKETFLGLHLMSVVRTGLNMGTTSASTVI
jgi:hypothetical protein